MSPIHILTLLVSIVQIFSSHPPHAQGVMMDKNQAMSFYKRFIDNNIDEECYGEESCVLGEVIEKFGHSEQSYEYWNTYRCNKSKQRCKGITCHGHSIGMKDAKIPDNNIDASSWQEPFHSFRPEAGRLDNQNGVWCPNTLGEADKTYFLQVELPSRYNVCAIATQGSPLYETDWVTKYRLEFSLDGENFMHYTENETIKEFTGNTNANDMLKHDLNRPITTHFIRFVPVEWNNKSCMRAEVYGTAIAYPWKAKNDKCCVFPFKYKGKKYYNVSSTGSGCLGVQQLRIIVMLSRGYTSDFLLAPILISLYRPIPRKRLKSSCFPLKLGLKIDTYLTLMGTNLMLDSYSRGKHLSRAYETW
ncbi:uncharacterized protein [Montipora capricornis]|uniref:uncharacterized protein n=1 Tax=Montipora capricornis TaxID=246305 RepID=UPI0035F1A4D8